MKVVDIGGHWAPGLDKAGAEVVAVVSDDPSTVRTMLRNRPHWKVDLIDPLHWDPTPYRGIDLVTGLDIHTDLVLRTAPRRYLLEGPDRLQGLRLDAADLGVPQHRRRAYLGITHRTVSFAQPTTVGAAIADLMGEGGWDGAELWAWAADSTPAPPLTAGTSGGAKLGHIRTRRTWLERFAVDGRSFADAPPAPDHDGPVRLTLRMGARLQGIDDDWQFVGNKSQTWRQIVSTVPFAVVATLL